MINCWYCNTVDCFLKNTNNLLSSVCDASRKKLNAKMCTKILYCSNENMLKKKQKCKIKNGYGLL
jgi:hypothetical protein